MSAQHRKQQKRRLGQQRKKRRDSRERIAAEAAGKPRVVVPRPAAKAEVSEPEQPTAVAKRAERLRDK